jgi:hypothetical protein
MVAFRIKITFPISVMVVETWLAAASNKLTGDIPELVACPFEAVTRLLPPVREEPSGRPDRHLNNRVAADVQRIVHPRRY